MATDHSITPFPADLDRDAFGHWLSGFTDGEGCFLLQFRKMGTAFIGVARFVIKLRQDDEEIVRLIHSYFGVGYVHYPRHLDPRINGKDQVAYQAQRTRDMAGVIVPHFERYPLRAKKQRDFAIWRQGVEVLSRVQGRHKRGRKGNGLGRRGINYRWTAAERTEFEELAEAIRRQRRFDAPAIAIPRPAHAVDSQP